MFIVSVFMSLMLSAGWMYMIYLYQEVICGVSIPGLYWMAMILNSYQVLTHVFTALKFIGYDIIIPGGAKDDQKIYEFTIHNTLDLLGWIMIFMYNKQLYWPYVLLAATHMGVGQVALIMYRTFQRFYIKDISQEYPAFQYVKLCFVVLDFIYRTHALYNM